eukprot:jgi/Picre1/28776/NNA_004173.t2
MKTMAESTWFQGREDAYGGFIIDSLSIPSTIDEFESQLSSSLEYWKHEREYRGIWLNLHRQHQHHLISPACTKGFEFHHAEKDYIMMTRIQAGARGAGEEWSFERMGVWKMPTGLVNEGEDITEAAVREVEEETQVKMRL